MAQHFETYTDLETALNLPALMPGAFRFAKQFAGATYTCSRCRQHKPLSHGHGGTGYARYGEQNDLVCYECCGDIDRERIIGTGKITLYLTHDRLAGTGSCGAGEVSNWPGTLKIPCRVKRGRHNIARYRHDVWFTGPDGKPWHGILYGDNTQLVHCKRTRCGGGAS